MSERHYCRLCHGKVVTRVELKPTPIANLFPSNPMAGKKYPLSLRECVECQHVQIGHVVPDDVLYGDSYKYVTPKTAELHDRAHTLRDVYPMAKDVLEIGANDGAFVMALSEAGFPNVVGIDPSTSNPHIVKATFPSDLPFQNFHLVVANNVFAHIDDLHSVFRGIADILPPDGAIVFEVQYFMDMAERGEFDMIYHEHRDYHTLTPLIGFLKKYGLGITVVERIPQHGGSIRVHCKRGPSIPIAEKTVDWDYFQAAIHAYTEQLVYEVDRASRSNQVILLGAPAKACTLLHQTGIADKIAYAVDSTPKKHDRYIAGTNIKILPEENLMQSKSGKTLLLAAWNYEEIFRKRYPDFDFIVPFKPRQRLAA